MFNKTLLILAFLNLLTLTNYSAISSTNSLLSEEISTTQKNVWSEINQISPYDNLFRSISEREGNDWRLLCAMAYHESRFQTDAVSRCGARGIMQIMPRVATQFDVTAEQLDNVEDNIYVANRLILLIDNMLGLPASTTAEDRLKITLATYNCGIGRVADARRLAKSFDENSNSWESISRYLDLMNNPEYYQNEVVKYGRFTGANETLAYVNNVVNHYEEYCSLAQR